MFNFIAGVIVGIALTTVGASGVAKSVDKIVVQTQLIMKNVSK